MQIPENGLWTFKNDEIAKSFDSHVREQLPWYDLATGAVKNIIRHYLPHDGVLYDIGASTGNITRSLKAILHNRNAKAISIDNSENMCKQFNGYGEIINESAESYSYKEFDCAVLFLTLMFIKEKDRKPLIDRLFSKLKKGGCIIVFDKIEPKGGYLSIVNSRLALAEKLQMGVSHQEIIDKELSLSGIQRPIGSEIYGGYEIIFKYGDFIGFIIEK
ncbi:hypothetical protein [Moraxella phage Mcat8]|uniref:methyltransferase domain-containing protein n=1 Tax=Moraxella catarrhalis TaxID=480 RepID=UPI0007227EC5|nr:methyltransferase domain-containing protein [Moraxella catarrhalis]AKI27361.1 hypothetical protein [Moraxella phage Mcat8]MPW78217.1 methyltransferase type 12 [Moraxella catarrhalis]RKL74619.1 methyltransferase domain-containing protein [Moraxella catarrhalis]RKM32988.1 methyltransferase domain-containing protein [Moraxella catarrhalis]